MSIWEAAIATVHIKLNQGINMLLRDAANELGVIIPLKSETRLASFLSACIVIRIAMFAVVFSILVSGTAWSQCRNIAKEPPNEIKSLPAPPPAYLMVLDHSGSMGLRTDSGRTRWEEMVERSVELIKTMALDGTYLWIAIFSAPASRASIYEFTLNNETDLIGAIKTIKDYPHPIVGRGGTALYDTIDMAFESAASISERNPGKYVSVMVYSDGEDEHSTLKKRDMQEKWQEDIQRFPHRRLFLIPLEGAQAPLNPSENIVIGNPKVPLSVQLSQNVIRLPCARSNPNPMIYLDFSSSQQVQGILSSIPKTLCVKCKLIPDTISGIEAELKFSEFELAMGRNELPVIIKNLAEAKGENRFRLELEYPDLPRYWIMAPKEISITFAECAPPPIYSMWPQTGDSFMMGSNIWFRVDTILDVDIAWDFGDGEGGTGQMVMHAYREAGSKEVSVTAKSPEGATNKTAVIEVVAPMSVHLSSPQERNYFEGINYKFSCTGSGTIDHYEWVVNGVPIADQKGSDFSYSFPRGGSHTIQVRGIAGNGASVYSPVVPISVTPLPVLIIRFPESGRELPPGEEVVFDAMATEPIRKVSFRILDPKTSDLLASGTSQVASQRARWAHSFPPEWCDKEIRIEAEGILEAGIQLELPKAEPVSCFVKSKPPKAQFVIKRGEREVDSTATGSTITLEDHSLGTITGRKWSLDGNPIPGSANQTSITYDCNDRGKLTFTLEVIGPCAGSAGAVTTQSRTLPVRNRWLAWLALVLCGGIYIVVFRLLTGNAPRYWTIHYERDPSPPKVAPRDLKFLPPKTSVKKYWSRVHKRATIPVKNMFRTPHWKTGAGKDEALVLSAQRKKNRLAPVLAPPNRDYKSITWEADLSGDTWHLVDGRAPDDEGSNVWFKVKTSDPAPTDALMLIGIFVIFSAFVAWIWHIA